MKPGIYRTILRDICGFKYNLNDPDPMLNPGMFELYKKMFLKQINFDMICFCNQSTNSAMNKASV